MFTYFVTTADQRRISIGRSRNPTTRLTNLQKQSREPLTLSLLLSGDRERELHERFAAHRVKGHWFTYAPEIKAFVAEYEQPPPRRIDFHEWLVEQRDEPDALGILAALVRNEPAFLPRTNKLFRLLDACGANGALRDAVKHAHRHWRLS